MGIGDRKEEELKTANGKGFPWTGKDNKGNGGMQDDMRPE